MGAKNLMPFDLSVMKELNTSGTWTDILSGKTVQGGSYTLNSGEALVLVNSSVIR